MGKSSETPRITAWESLGCRKKNGGNPAPCSEHRNGRAKGDRMPKIVLNSRLVITRGSSASVVKGPCKTHGGGFKRFPYPPATPGRLTDVVGARPPRASGPRGHRNLIMTKRCTFLQNEARQTDLSVRAKGLTRRCRASGLVPVTPRHRRQPAGR